MWKKKEKNNKGFTLVEVLVACAILGIALAPILSSFVSVARVNMTSRKKMTANTIGESVMEATKAFELRDFAYQCYAVQNPASKADFKIIAKDLVNNVAFNGSAAEIVSGAAATGPRAEKDADGKITFTPSADKNYEFMIIGIPMGGTKYDAIVTYQYDAVKSEEEYTDADGHAGNVQDKLGEFGIRSLKYYNLTVKVYKSEDGSPIERYNNYMTKSPLCRLTGTKADYD